MAQPESIEDAIEQNAKGPKRVQVANQSVEQHSIDGSTSGPSWSDIDLSTAVGGQQAIDTVTLADAPTEGQFFLNEDVAGEFGPFNYNSDASAIDSAIDVEGSGDATFDGSALTVRCELNGPIHPLTGEPRRRAQARPDSIQMRAMPLRLRRAIDATYDVARDSDEFKNVWLDCEGTISSTGTGSIAFDDSALSGSGFQPNAGPGAVSFSVSALAAVGSVSLAGPGAVTFGAALSGAGSIPNLGSGGVSFDSALAGVGTWGFLAKGGIAAVVSEVFGRSDLADTSLGYKHYKQFSSVVNVRLG